MLFYDGDMPVLTVEEVQIAEGILLKCTGELRSDAAHPLQDEIDAYATIGVNVVLDLQGLTFLAYSAIYALLSCQNRIDSLGKGELRLVNVPSSIYQELDRANVTEMLLIEEPEVTIG